MKFPTALVKGTLLKRYKRFLADIQLDQGEKVIAHCANPGAMLGLIDPGNEVWLSQVSPRKDQKLSYHWEVVRVGEEFVGIHTGKPNFLFQEAFIAQKFPEFDAYSSFRREVPYGENSRIDFLLEEKSLPPCYVEIKNVHLKRGEHVQFPDSVTQRGAKHLKELIEMKRKGARSVVFYLVQRNDADLFSIAEDIDPFYTQLAKEAKDAGVEFFCYACDVTPFEIVVKRPLRIV